MLTGEALVEYEQRVKLQKAGFAAAAAVMLVIGAAVSLSGPTASVGEATIQLIYEHKRASLEIINSVATALGYFALAWALDWLFRSTRARNLGFRREFRFLTLSGATLLFFTGPIYTLVILHNASQFVSHGQQTYMQAKTLDSGTGYVVIGVLLNFGLLLLAAGFIATALGAMRVGLLPRVLGYTGILAGVLVILPIGYVAPFIQAIWLLAFVWLLAGRWTSGTPEAWRTGTAVPWLSPAEMREQRESGAPDDRRARGADRIEGRSAKSAVKVRLRATEPDAVGAEDGDDEAEDVAARTRATTPKRKRKKRR